MILTRLLLYHVCIYYINQSFKMAAITLGLNQTSLFFSPTQRSPQQPHQQQVPLQTKLVLHLHCSQDDFRGSIYTHTLTWDLPLLATIIFNEVCLLWEIFAEKFSLTPDLKQCLQKKKETKWENTKITCNIKICMCMSLLHNIVKCSTRRARPTILCVLMNGAVT